VERRFFRSFISESGKMTPKAVKVPDRNIGKDESRMRVMPEFLL
jgi:hypothetical protein